MKWGYCNSFKSLYSINQGIDYGQTCTDSPAPINTENRTFIMGLKLLLIRDSSNLL